MPRTKPHNALLLLLTLALVLMLPTCRTERRLVDLSQVSRLGKAGAPIEIVVFSDFQCIYCKRAARELKKIYREMPNRVRIYYKHFPLSRHPEAWNAARAAEAARLQGKFWEMHDLLFDHNDALGADQYVALAKELGLDAVRFKADLWSKQTSDRVAADKAEGLKLGVDATPYFLINRMPFRGSYADIADRVEGFEGFR